MTKNWTVNELKQKLETDIPQPEYEGEWNPDIEEQLKQKLSTKVAVNSKGDGAGKIEIEFYNHEEEKSTLCYFKAQKQIWHNYQMNNIKKS